MLDYNYTFGDELLIMLAFLIALVGLLLVGELIVKVFGLDK